RCRARLSVVRRPSPSAGAPAPGGKPVPSGGMLTSAPAICSGVAGTPRPGPFGAAGRDCCADSQPLPITPSDRRRHAATLRVDIADLPLRRDTPALRAVVVIAIQRTPPLDHRLARR